MTAIKRNLWFFGSYGILAQMTLRDFKSKYVGSLMGIFWTVINPLLLLVIFTFVFTVIFKAKFGEQAGFGHNALYILAGILPWIAFQEGIGRSSTVLLEHRNLITRVRFPGEILPGVPILSALLGQIIGFMILLVLAVIYFPGTGKNLYLLPLLVILQLVFTLGLSWAVSALSVYLRDLLHLIPVLLLVWMFGTPIFYPASLVPEKFQMLINLNPIAHLVSAYRFALFGEPVSYPWLQGILFLSVFAFASLLIGSIIFRKLAKNFADQL
jgi:ABC-type polysaccharide/polyol phosphate export permease